MVNIIDALAKVPDYLAHMWKDYPYILVPVAIVYVICLIFSNKAVKVLREVLIAAIVVYACIGGFTRRRYWGLQMVWTAIIMLVVLIIVRLIVNAVRTSRENAINRRIEKRALEKAAQHRGSFREKQAYSGKTRPVEKAEEEPVELTTEEIRSVVDADDLPEAVAEAPREMVPEKKTYNAFTDPDLADAFTGDLPPVNVPESTAAPEAAAAPSYKDLAPNPDMTLAEAKALAAEQAKAAESAAASGAKPAAQAAGDAASAAAPEAAAGAAGSEEDSSSMSATDLYDFIQNLSALHDAGILTDEEFSKKKAELLSRI